MRPLLPAFVLLFASLSAQESIVTRKPKNTVSSKLAPGSVIGRFEIPRLQLAYPLLEGTDHKTLDRGIGHIEGTALIGEPGNIGIAGHRNTHFRKLEWIRRGDEIILTNAGAKHVYRVEWIRLHNPVDVDVLDAAQGPAITLVTCFPFEYVGAAPLRFIVRAVPASAPVASAGGSR